MYNVYNSNTLNIFKSMLICNSSIHSHDARQSVHYHIPLVKRDVSKTCLSYRGAVMWNDILKCDIKIKESEYVFCGDFKCKILKDVL